MKKPEKTRANAGETLVEVTAGIFLFLIMMGILQGQSPTAMQRLQKTNRYEVTMRLSWKNCKIQQSQKEKCAVCSLWQSIRS